MLPLILGGLGAAASIWGADRAADAQEDASRDQQQTAYQNWLAQLRLSEPQRNLGYQAMGDLASVYGYGMSPYPTQADITRGRQPGAGVSEGVERMLARVGVPADVIARVRANAAQNQSQANPGMAGSPAGPPGNMSRFFTSPDYTFRRDEGIRGLEQSAAARGGAFSGDALKGLTDFNQNLAASEYGNWHNRVSAMAGMGQTATNNVSNASNSAANQMIAAQGNAGDARASGIMGGVTGAINAANAGLYNYQIGQYLNGQQRPPQLSPYGPYSTGYRFPG